MLDAPPGRSDPIAPPPGCVGTLAALVVGLIVLFALLASPTDTAPVGVMVGLAVVYGGMIVVHRRTRVPSTRAFARAMLVALSIVVFGIVAVLVLVMRGAAVLQ